MKIGCKRLQALTGMVLVAAMSAVGATRTWTGADVANDPSWSNGNNWQGGIAPVAGDTAKFANNAGEIEVGAGDLELGDLCHEGGL